jgi:hypothetical protein
VMLGVPISYCAKVTVSLNSTIPLAIGNVQLLPPTDALRLPHEAPYAWPVNIYVYCAVAEQTANRTMPIATNQDLILTNVNGRMRLARNGGTALPYFFIMRL